MNINELAAVKSVAAMAATVATAPTPLYMYILTLKCLLFNAQVLIHITIHLMDNYYDLY